MEDDDDDDVQIAEESITVLADYREVKSSLKSLEEFCIRTNLKNTELCFQMFANFERENNELAPREGQESFTEIYHGFL